MPTGKYSSIAITAEALVLCKDYCKEHKMKLVDFITGSAMRAIETNYKITRENKVHKVVERILKKEDDSGYCETLTTTTDVVVPLKKDTTSTVKDSACVNNMKATEEDEVKEVVGGCEEMSLDYDPSMDTDDDDDRLMRR